MKAIAGQVLFAVLWLVGILAAVTVALLLAAHLWAPNLARSRPFAKLCGDLATNIYIFLLCFGLLPGVRRRRGEAVVLGPWAALRVIAGFAVMIAAGALAVYNLLFVEQLVLAARHSGRHVDFGSANALIVSALVGELISALWLAWFLRGVGAARVVDGGVAGVAWRPASREAYITAALAAAVIILAVAVLYHFVPPNLDAMKDLPDAKMFEHPGIFALPLVGLFVVFGPVLEELVFRGAAFAGLAARLGPVWAGVISTALFVALHAPEKIHYPAGFIDVGVMAAAACWLRVRFGSIRPGILLHVLYNGGLMLAGGMMR